LLVFENIEVVDYKRKIESLQLDEDVLEELQHLSFKPSRLARAGRVNLKTDRDISIEGDENFQIDSDPPVASSVFNEKSTGKRGSKYGVNSHTKNEDNWQCNYCGTINEENT